MPLTSTSSLYKTFPPQFADRVTQHVKTRAEVYKSPKASENDSTEVAPADMLDRCKENLKKKHEPPSETTSSIERPSCTKRPRTPLCDLKHGGDPGPNKDGSKYGAKEQCACSKKDAAPSRGDRTQGFVPIQDVGRPDSRLDLFKMETDSRSSSPSSYTPRGRTSRSNSRTTVSLDNVDLWESDEESEAGYDNINGVLVNPRKTFDFSEFRKLNRSPLCVVGMGVNKSRTRSPHPAPHAPSPSQDPVTSQSKGRRSANSSPHTSPRLPLNQTVDLTESRLPPSLRLKSPHVTPRSVKTPIDVPSEKDSPSIRHRSGIDKGRPLPGSSPSSFRKRTDKAEETKVKTKPRVRVTKELRPLFGDHDLLKISHKEPVRNVSGYKSDYAPTPTTPIPIPARRRNSKMDCDDSDGSPGGSTGSRSPDRKVTFSNLVSVRQGQLNTLDPLRNSNNSAQILKQKYLSPRARARSRRPESPSNGEESMDQWQLAF